MKQTIQIENINAEDFKNQIIDGILEQLKLLTQTVPTLTEPDKLLTREETAKLLSISMVSLWKLDKQKLFPVYRIGRGVRYKQSEVLAAVENQSLI